MAEQPSFSDKFRELNSRDVSAHVEKKQNLNYLSWAYVQQELTKEDPNYTERVIEFPYPDSTNENFFCSLSQNQRRLHGMRRINSIRSN